MKPKHFLFLFWLVVAWFWGYAAGEYDVTTAELVATVEGYRECIERAGELGCQMTPDDFVEYYQAKRELEGRE